MLHIMAYGAENSESEEYLECMIHEDLFLSQVSP